MYLSPQAQKAQDESRMRARIGWGMWQDGPRLEGDRVIVPSTRYCEQAAQVWKQHGFTFFGGAYPTWSRDTSRPARNGQVYSPAAWLEAAIRQYRELWPDWAGPEGR